jgi:hypothetical protein
MLNKCDNGIEYIKHIGLLTQQIVKKIRVSHTEPQGLYFTMHPKLHE